jgi:hypothetical protein
MGKLLLGVAALALVSIALPASAVERKADTSVSAQSRESARPSAHKQRHRTARRHHARRHHARRHASRYRGGLHAYGGGYGGYVRMPGDGLGRNPAVEYYRAHGRCVTDEGYGRYTFCDF